MSGGSQIAVRLGENIPDLLDQIASKAAQTASTISQSFNFTGLEKSIDSISKKKSIISLDALSSLTNCSKEVEGLCSELSKLEKIAGKTPDVGLLDKLESSLKTVIQDSLKTVIQDSLKIEETKALFNVSAQLDKESMAKLDAEIRKVSLENSLDPVEAFSGFSKIYDKVKDIKKAMEINTVSMKASYAAGTTSDQLSETLMKTMSVAPNKDMDATELTDSLFAAKRIGKGIGFQELEEHLPGLVETANSLKYSTKDVAGLFAFMSTKAKDASASSGMLKAVFKDLSKTKVQSSFAAQGVDVKKDGKLLQLGDISEQLSSKMKGLSDDEKIKFMKKLGLSSDQTRKAFLYLASDSKNLTECLKQVNNSAGLMNKSISASTNPLDQLSAIMNDFKNVGAAFGALLVPVISYGISILASSVHWLCEVLMIAIGGIQSFIQSVLELNPLALYLAYVIGVVSLVMTMNTIIAKKDAIWKSITATATSVCTAAQWLFNTALAACPIVWIVAGILSLVGVIMLVASKTTGWGEQWSEVMRFIKLVCSTYIGGVKLYFTSLLNCVLYVIDKIRVGWYKVKNFFGFGDSKENDAEIKKINDGISERYKKLKDSKDKWVSNLKDVGKGIDIKVKMKKENKDENSFVSKVIGFFGGGKKDDKSSNQSGSGKGAGDRTKPNILNLNASGKYAAIASKLAPVDISGVQGGHNTITRKINKSDSQNKLSDATQVFKDQKENYLKTITDEVKKIAAILAISCASASMAYAQDNYVETPKKSSFSAETPKAKIEKFCDQIVINIPNTVEDPEELVDMITEKVVERFNKELDTYE
ncbi:MAG: phage tail tape measure protein [Marinifilaceae bacterium]|jgi:hypothetical protein|nr:phage tail tape measure protein [Marinifilaceae bacterium]